MKHFDLHHILNDAQHGFRNMTLMRGPTGEFTVHGIAKNLALEVQVNVILLEFSKAFSKVHHQRLLHNLQYCGVGNKSLIWIGPS